MPDQLLGNTSAERPNVVFILADDLGGRDLGCYGSDEVSSPVLDQLAADGIRFTHAYAASPWCSPTRIALYTGRSPGRLEGGLEEPLRTRSEEMGLPPEHPTVASLLVEQGYSTAMFGKWHCGWAPWFGPTKSGFQTFFGNLDGAVDYHEHFGTLGEHDMWEGDERVEVEGYYTDLISQRTADYIREHSDGPFYVQVNYTAPHWPWEGRGDADIGAEIKREYEEGEVRVPILHLAGGSIAKYVEMIEIMDEGIGQILDAIDETGNRDNTLVIFASDNGGERWSNNWPFVGEKGDITEGGIRVPFIVRWPAVVEPGHVCDEPNVTMDWTATIVEAAGASPRADYPFDGVSLLDWLSGETPYPEHDLFWRIASQGAMRRGRFKYVRDLRPRPVLGQWPRYPGDYHLLYDVTVDGREAAEIARHHPDVVAEMAEAWRRYEADLLPYPPNHPNLPRHASKGKPAVSQAD